MKLSTFTLFLPPCLVVADIVAPPTITTEVVSNTTELKEGVFRYHYENNTTACTVITLIGVGTAMKVDDYDLLAVEMATSRQGLIAGFIDHAPGNPVKVSESRYTRLVEALIDKMHEVVPICSRTGVITGSINHPPTYVIGGHSASGGAAMRSLSSLSFSPVGFIGLSPFRITNDMDRISIPALYWGFSTETCGVVVKFAADAAYSLSSPDHGRVLYQLQNPSGKPSHCVFANNGCLPICPTSHRKDYDWIRPAVGQSIGKFLAVVETNTTFSRDSLRLQLPKQVSKLDLKMFVNEENIAPNFVGLPEFEALW